MNELLRVTSYKLIKWTFYKTSFKQFELRNYSLFSNWLGPWNNFLPRYESSSFASYQQWNSSLCTVAGKKVFTEWVKIIHLIIKLLMKFYCFKMLCVKKLLMRMMMKWGFLILCGKIWEFRTIGLNYIFQGCSFKWRTLFKWRTWNYWSYIGHSPMQLN